MEIFKVEVIGLLNSELVIADSNNRYFSVAQADSNKEYVSRVPFGMNFFIGIIGLILISSSKKFYLIEIGVQLLFGAIIFSAFLYGVKGNTFLLRISDMASIYFLPLSSLFMVVLAFIEKKALKGKELYEG